MSFYVNEDRPSNRATVHRAVCPMAQFRTKKNPRDGRWHGPFATADQALDTAEATTMAFARVCRICNARSHLSIRFPAIGEDGR